MRKKDLRRRSIEGSQKADIYLNYLGIMRNEYGELPGTAHIILGDLYFNANEEQKSLMNNLLDGESIQFSAQDIFDLHGAVKDAELFKLVSIKNIVDHRDKTQFLAFYAQLFKPFMQSSFFSYLPTEKSTFRSIRDLFDAELKLVNPMKRHGLTQRLNVLAMFESGLAGSAADEALAELYVRMQSGAMSSSLATVAALEKWDIDGVREDKVATCIQTLDAEAVKSYEWIEDDLKDFLDYRLNHPDIELPSTYSEDLIAEYCGKVRNGECSIEEATRAITVAWAKDDILDNAIADCAEQLNEANGNERDQADYLETVTSLRDFTLSKLSGRGSTYIRTDEENATYIQDCFDMLWDIHAQYNGQLPGVAQILLGDIWPIANHAQENEIIALLDNKQVSFSEEDVAELLSGIGNDNPLDVISLENIEKYCTANDPIVLYAALLKPFMKDKIDTLSEDEENDLSEIIDFMGSDQSLDFEERQEIISKLNIMAVFESGLAEKYAAMTNYGELIQQLSDEIEKGEKSVQEAADSLYRQLDYDDALEYDIQTCVGLLVEEGFQSYTWADDEEDESGSYSQSGSDDSLHEALSYDFEGSNLSRSQSGDDDDADDERSPVAQGTDNQSQRDGHISV